MLGKIFMQTMSATDVKHGFGAALDAAQREPVIIQKQNRDVAVLLSVAEYDKLRGLRLQIFDHIADAIAARAAENGLTDEIFDHLMSDVS